MTNAPAYCEIGSLNLPLISTFGEKFSNLFHIAIVGNNNSVVLYDFLYKQRRHDTQHDDIQHNDTQHNYIQLNDRVLLCWLIYAECHFCWKPQQILLVRMPLCWMLLGRLPWRRKQHPFKVTLAKVFLTLCLQIVSKVLSGPYPKPYRINKNHCCYFFVKTYWAFKNFTKSVAMV